jgi:hypothetical protein
MPAIRSRQVPNEHRTTANRNRIPPDALEVILEAFEGPLDLLLYLIRRQNLDILDIPVAEITRQYMDYIESNCIKPDCIRPGVASRRPAWHGSRLVLQRLACREPEIPEIPCPQARNCHWTEPAAAAVSAANGPANFAPTIHCLG